MEGGIDTALTSRLRQSVGEKCRGGRGGGLQERESANNDCVNNINQSVYNYGAWEVQWGNVKRVMKNEWGPNTG